jgi:hypothetical protein
VNRSRNPIRTLPPSRPPGNPYREHPYISQKMRWTSPQQVPMIASDIPTWNLSRYRNFLVWFDPSISE